MLTTVMQQGEQFLRQTYRNLLFFQAKNFHDYIFIHINKTGGTSVEKALGLPLIHKTAREYKKEVGDAYWQDRFSFAVVRNPWDKIASQFHYRSMIDETQMRKKPIQFNDWVKRVFIDQDPDYYNEEKMFIPQMDWLTDIEGYMLVNFIARFENLSHDWPIICENINRQGVELPHVKKSSRTDYRGYYDTESTEIIAKFFAQDIEQFSYRFE